MEMLEEMNGEKVKQYKVRGTYKPLTLFKQGENNGRNKVI